jgi:hypothetical protein
VFAEALDSQLATKANIDRLELRMAGMDGKLTLIQWMPALVVAAEVMPLAAKLFR